MRIPSSPIPKKRKLSTYTYVDELNSINHNIWNQLFTVPIPEKEKTIDDSVHEILN